MRIRVPHGISTFRKRKFKNVMSQGKEFESLEDFGLSVISI